MQHTVYPFKDDLQRKARVLSLAGDASRIRILCLLFDRKEACVSEIAEALGMKIATASHHLQVMKEGGMVEAERRGNTFCYRVIKDPVMENIETVICSS